MRLILYSKPGCHLCEGLQEKLLRVQPPLDLEVRDITSREDWFQTYQYEIPVLLIDRGEQREESLPRPSPRATVRQLEQMLQNYRLQNGSE